MHSSYIYVLFSNRSNNTRRNPILDRSCEKNLDYTFSIGDTLYVLYSFLFLDSLDIYLTEEKKCNQARISCKSC